MFHRSILRLSVIVVGFALTVSSLSLAAQDDDNHHGRKFKVPPPSARVEVTVLREANGKPIEAAAVIFHPMEGDKDKGSMELKTNQDGKAMIDVIPIGDTVRMQIIAKGFQTYGQDYKIDKPQITMEVRMKRPGGQYSIYKQKGESSNPDGNAGEKKSEKPSTDTPPPPANPKP
jgi:5-hydroxyisourate hydrolase-like protein (transthyretin family)